MVSVWFSLSVWLILLHQVEALHEAELGWRAVPRGTNCTGGELSTCVCAWYLCAGSCLDAEGCALLQYAA
jgi:hypothetical protein